MTGYLRLRQICLVAPALEPALAELAQIFGLELCYRDPHVAKYGLVNGLFPVGTSFLEVVAPTRPGTAAGRYLERRGGAGGYMVLLECHDIERRRAHVEALGVRIANPVTYPTYLGIQLHPRDTGGTLLELNHAIGDGALDGSYEPAGPDWQKAIRRDVTRALIGAELQSPDPAALARRWSAIIERPVVAGASGAPEIAVDDGVLRFVPAADGRGEGLGGLDLAAANRAAILEAAARREKEIAGDVVSVGGMWFRLVS
jgi:hypothetical protein